jgi:hypothetical protein
MLRRVVKAATGRIEEESVASIQYPSERPPPGRERHAPLSQHPSDGSAFCKHEQVVSPGPRGMRMHTVICPPPRTYRRARPSSRFEVVRTSGAHRGPPASPARRPCGSFAS